jgi:hypothetical protein
MSKPGWGAIVQGELKDLEKWADRLKEPFDPWTEIHGKDTVLRSASLDQATTASDVRDRALAYIDRLNGAVALSQHVRPLRFGGVLQFVADGPPHRILFSETFFDAESFLRADTIQIGPDGKPIPEPPPQPSDVQRWFEIADRDDLLDDALMHFGKGANWFDIYKALECLFAGDQKAFLALNWAPEKEVERLRYTANWFRHARRRNDLPAMPLKSLDDARALLAQLLQRALRESKP